MTRPVQITSPITGHPRQRSLKITAARVGSSAIETLATSTRLAVAIVGVIAAGLVILLGTTYPAASWLFVLLGVTLSATSVRAARRPGLLRAGTLAVNLALVPMVLIYLYGLLSFRGPGTQSKMGENPYLLLGAAPTHCQ
jgi:hypothetical protein